MNNLQELFAGFRLVVLGETTCRLFFVSSPIIWIYGCFFLGINAITIYSKYSLSVLTLFLVIFGMFMIICGVFSASNTIHVCVQLPTSTIALKIQKIGQTAILAIYFVLVLVGFVLANFSDFAESEKSKVLEEYESFFYNEITFLVLFFLTTLSCVLS